MSHISWCTAIDALYHPIHTMYIPSGKAVHRWTEVTSEQLKCSLLHFPVTATSPYPEPDQFSPCPTSQFLKTSFNIILPSTPGSTKRHVSLTFLHLKPEYASPILPTLYISRPLHSSQFYHPNNIGWAIQTINLLIMQQPSLTVTSSFLGSNI